MNSHNQLYCTCGYHCYHSSCWVYWSVNHLATCETVEGLLYEWTAVIVFDLFLTVLALVNSDWYGNSLWLLSCCPADCCWTNLLAFSQSCSLLWSVWWWCNCFLYFPCWMAFGNLVWWVMTFCNWEKTTNYFMYITVRVLGKSSGNEVRFLSRLAI